MHVLHVLCGAVLLGFPAVLLSHEAGQGRRLHEAVEALRPPEAYLKLLRSEADDPCMQVAALSSAQELFEARAAALEAALGSERQEHDRTRACLDSATGQVRQMPQTLHSAFHLSHAAPVPCSPSPVPCMQPFTCTLDQDHLLACLCDAVLLSFPCSAAVA